MQNTLLIGLSRQVALQRELDVVANNLANINTTGYKADNSLFEEFLPNTARAASTGDRISFVRDRGTWHDFSSGTIEQTGDPLNVAIDGAGYLVVQTPRGERYTRNGTFHLSPTGDLVTSEGYQVMGEAGPIKLQRTDRQVEISKDGTISVREGALNTDSVRGKLRLVNFDTPGRLQKDGTSTFMAPDNMAPNPTKAATLIQGSLERSNVQSVLEMTRMIEITRSYTQVSTMMQQQNDLRSATMTKLADVQN